MIKKPLAKIRFTPAVLFALMSVICFIGYLITKFFLSPYTIDIQLHDTYFVIAHTHAMIFPALIFLIFSAVYYYYPLITGRGLNAPMGYIHFAITVIAICVIVWPVNYASPIDMPRSELDYKKIIEHAQLSEWINSLKVKTAFLLIGAQLVLVINLIYSAVKGEKRRAI